MQSLAQRGASCEYRARRNSIIGRWLPAVDRAADRFVLNSSAGGAAESAIADCDSRDESGANDRSAGRVGRGAGGDVLRSLFWKRPKSAVPAKYRHDGDDVYEFGRLFDVLLAN